MKRLFDTLASAIALVLASPILALIAAAVLIVNGRPILFRQQRPGLQGRPFSINKFRTMTIPGTSELEADGGTARVTALGRWLRASSLDELPELWNVLIGQMSLVGPRPLLMEYLPLYDERQRRRHDVRPGITGWAQVNGRNAIDWDEKLELDVWYVENRSFALDFRILLLTVAKVWRRHGINQGAGVTMPPFRGSAARECDDGNRKAGHG